MLSSLPVFGQQVDADDVNRVNREAIELITDGKFRLAEKKINDLLLALEAQNADIKFIGLCYQTKAKVIQNLGRYDEAYELSKRSYEIALMRQDSSMMADDLNTMGIIHYFRSDYDSTSHYYSRSFELKKKLRQKPYSLAISAYNLGMVYEDLGNIQKALEYYLDAESNLKKSNRERNFLSDVYVGISGIHYYNGDIEKAQLYAEEAMEEGMKNYGEFNPNMTFVYTSYSNILESQQKYKQAIHFLEKSLGIRKEHYGQDHRWTCEAYYDLANAYALDGQTEKAVRHYQQAIAIGQRIGSRQYLSFAQSHLAKLYIDQQMELAAAETLLNSSLKQKKRIFGERNEVVAADHYQMARIAFQKQDRDHFISQVENSLRGANYQKDSLENLIDPISAINTLLLQIQWNAREYEKDRQERHLLKSFGLIEESQNLVRHAQRNFSSDRSRIDMANKFREVFEVGLDLCWKLYHLKKEPMYLEKAFDLSEENRNTSLLRGLQDIKFKLFAEIPERLRQFEKDRKSELERVKMDLYYERSAVEPDREILSDLLHRRIELTRTLDSLYQELHENYPRYADLKFGDEGIGLRDLQEALADDQQVLTYFLGDRMLYSFTITREEVKFLRGDVADKLQDYTREFKKGLVERKDITAVSQDLYLYLLGQQMDPAKKKIVVIADNVLNYIPYESLMNVQGQYLLEDFTVSYSGSCRIFLELKSEFFQYEQGKTWVGFAPAYKGDLALSNSKKEVELISEITGGDTYIGAFASKQAFLENNKSYSVIHLAMHAEIDHGNPMYNRLLFADGDLTASEIYTSGNKANLAVLSACNTGFGKLEKGEGVMSMARAFHFSGVPAVVMSLWRVPDRETRSIMVSFYKNLTKGWDKGEAMRKAKLEYLSNTSESRLRHPYYWSGFVLNGNSDGLEDYRSNRRQLIFGLLLLAVVVAGYVVRIRKA